MRHDEPRDAARVLVATGQLDVRVVLEGDAEGDGVEVAVRLDEAGHRGQADDVGGGHGGQVGGDELHRQALLGHADAGVEHLDARLTFPHALALIRDRHQGLGRGESPVHERPLTVGDVTNRLAGFGQVGQVFAAQSLDLLAVLGDLAVDVEADHGDHREDHAAGHHHHGGVLGLAVPGGRLRDRHEHHDAHRPHHGDHHGEHVTDAGGLRLVRRRLDGDLPLRHLRYALQEILRVSHRSSLCSRTRQAVVPAILTCND